MWKIIKAWWLSWKYFFGDCKNTCNWISLETDGKEYTEYVHFLDKRFGYVKGANNFWSAQCDVLESHPRFLTTSKREMWHVRRRLIFEFFKTHGV